MATLLDSDTFTFADGDSGHSCDLGSAPNVGETDVLCVNSNTVVDTPVGWTAAESKVVNQGAYIFVRKAAGGEASTVSVNTGGNHNTFVGWARWAGINAVDTSTSTAQDGSAGNNTPVHSTGTLAEAGELVVAFGALHSIGTANQTSVTWSAGFTGLLNAVQDSGATGVRGLVGYKDGAGTAAEAPQVSWSNDGVQNAYMLTVTFTAGATTVNGVAAGVLGAVTGAAAGLRTVKGSAVTALAGLTATATGVRTVSGVAAASLGSVAAVATGVRRVSGRGVASLGGLLAETAIPTGPAVSGGSWWGLLDVAREARQIAAAEAARVPVACPNDGEPLRAGPRGEMYCPWDGWQPGQ